MRTLTSLLLAGLLASTPLAAIAEEPLTGDPDVTIRQDGDSTERIQEAIDTCPVDCIHWVPYERLPALQEQRDSQDLLPLGLPSPTRIKRTLPRAPGGHQPPAP